MTRDLNHVFTAVGYESYHPLFAISIIESRLAENQSALSKMTPVLVWANPFGLSNLSQYES
jgi:hypothetical protein